MCSKCRGKMFMERDERYHYRYWSCITCGSIVYASETSKLLAVLPDRRGKRHLNSRLKVYNAS